MENKLDLIRQKCVGANPVKWKDWDTFEYAEFRLADVLLAIQNTRVQLAFYGADQLWIVESKAGLPGRVSTKWNLPEDDLMGQSEETINFLYELLR
jgi:hypothetical protein